MAIDERANRRMLLCFPILDFRVPRHGELYQTPDYPPMVVNELGESLTPRTILGEPFHMPDPRPEPERWTARRHSSDANLVSICRQGEWYSHLTPDNFAVLTGREPPAPGETLVRTERGWEPEAKP